MYTCTARGTSVGVILELSPSVTLEQDRDKWRCGLSFVINIAYRKRAARFLSSMPKRKHDSHKILLLVQLCNRCSLGVLLIVSVSCRTTRKTGKHRS